MNYKDVNLNHEKVKEVVKSLLSDSVEIIEKDIPNASQIILSLVNGNSILTIYLKENNKVTFLRQGKDISTASWFAQEIIIGVKKL